MSRYDRPIATAGYSDRPPLSSPAFTEDDVFPLAKLAGVIGWATSAGLLLASGA